MPETSTRTRAGTAAGDLLVQLRALDPDLLLSAVELAALTGCTVRATQRWLRQLGPTRALVPGVAHLYRAGDLIAAIMGAR